LIYYPIFKVASSSWKNWFLKLLNLRMDEGFKHHPYENQRFPTVTKGAIEQHQNYFKFGFVRNPWDRLISCFEDKKSFRTPQ